MRGLPKFIVTVMVLVFLMTSSGGFGFHPKEFAHDLDHHGQPQPLAFDHAHPDVFVPVQEGQLHDDASETAAELEHQLLHAVGTVHLVTGSTANFSWDFAKHVLTPLSSTRRLLVALPESPFRPPRSPAFA